MNNHPDSQDEKAMRIAYLIAGFLQQTLTPDEHDELDRWVEASDENMLLFEELTDEENITAGLQKMRQKDSDPVYQKLRTKLPFTPEKRKRPYWPYAVAASLVLLAVSLYLLRPPSAGEQGASTAIVTATDMAPGTNKATLRLADGRQIILENQRSGAVESGAAFTITSLDSGHIAYREGATGAEAQYHTLTTPNGGQYKLTLSDGTRVWLNAASSLRYPVVFQGSERIVELTGEAYLEVARNAAKPFYVRSKGQEIKVLGTAFNVEAYGDDKEMITTLLEGSIQLTTTGRNVVLTPGQKALVDGGGTIRVQAADVASAVAWKNGWFRFRDAAIEDVMKEIGRWYNARVIYNGAVEKHFNGDIARNLPVSKVLELMEKTGSVRFTLEDKTIIVQP